MLEPKDLTEYINAEQKASSFRHNNPDAYNLFVMRMVRALRVDGPNSIDDLTKETESFLCSPEVAAGVVQDLYCDVKDFIPPIPTPEAAIAFGAMHGWTLAILFLRSNPEYIDTWIEPMVRMEYISECCGAIPFDDSLDLTWPTPAGRCNQCKEMSEFTNDSTN
jgi:hypothetical protein